MALFYHHQYTIFPKAIENDPCIDDLLIKNNLLMFHAAFSATRPGEAGFQVPQGKEFGRIFQQPWLVILVMLVKIGCMLEPTVMEEHQKLSQVSDDVVFY